MIDDMMVRLVNKNTIAMSELQKKQENLYHAVTSVDNLVNALCTRIGSLEKEITAIKKTNQILKEAEFL